MKAILSVVLLVLMTSALVLAQGVPDVDESKLSPEAKALKAKYDAQLQKLQADFTRELTELKARVDKVEGKPAAPAKKAWYDTMTVKGYVQARYQARQYDSNLAAVDEFMFRRLYLALVAPLSNKSKAVVMWEGAGPTMNSGAYSTWADLYADYNVTPNWTIRMGQGPTFFGLDDHEGSSVRPTPERAVAFEGNSNLKIRGICYLGPWDRGAWAIYDTRPKPTAEGWRAVLGCINGQFREPDVSSGKTWTADVEYYGDWGQAGVSWIDGKHTSTMAGSPAPKFSDDRKAWGLNVRVNPKVNWGFQAEYINGTWASISTATKATDTKGYYGQLSYAFDNSGEPLPDALMFGKMRQMGYVRYERFDPGNDGTSNPDFAVYKGIHVGYKYRLTNLDDVTLEFNKGKLGDKKADDLVFQYQHQF